MSTGILTVTLSSTELASEGIVAKGFAKDLTSSTDEYIERWLLEVNRELGPVSVIHWNACTHMQKSVLELTNEDFDEAMAIVKGKVIAVDRAAATKPAAGTTPALCNSMLWSGQGCCSILSIFRHTYR